jgi:hypothetical protein
MSTLDTPRTATDSRFTEVAATHPYTAAAPYFGSTTSANQEGHRTASCISRREMGLSACKQGTSNLPSSIFKLILICWVIIVCIFNKNNDKVKHL